ncbi:hypothetical protein E2320_010990 [Naja naja]|nr:hypothetical protein E2320_010990 [Naja naja]
MSGVGLSIKEAGVVFSIKSHLIWKFVMSNNRSQAILISVYRSHNIQSQQDKIQRVIGRHGMCKCSNTDLLLLKTSATHNLITNTTLHLHSSNKTS